jgi:hypothetical protein
MNVASGFVDDAVGVELSHRRGVTLEYQRQRAKEMTKYFQNAKLQQQMVSSKCVRVEAAG